MKFKYFKIFTNILIYSLSFLLILFTYENVIHEKKIPKVDQETAIIWLDVNNQKIEEEQFDIQDLTNNVMKRNILEKKILKFQKTIEKEQKYKLQLLSIKKQKFSKKIEREIEQEFAKFDIGKLIFEETDIPSLGKFIRVQTKNNFIKEEAKLICEKLIKKDKKCMIFRIL